MAALKQSGHDLALDIRRLRHTYREIRGLRKRGPERIALDGIDLSVAAGEVHGLLGPNGAGKSTLSKILATILVPTSGQVTVLGHDVVRRKDRVRSCLSLVLGGERGLYYRLSARQNLRFWGSLYGLSDRETNRRADHLLDRVRLLDRADDRVESFSRGMKQRLHLARGLLPDPRVIVLDEPTTGMDPVATKEFRELVQEVREGRTILLTTHDMVEAETLCGRVTLINSGRIIATASPRTLATWTSRFERVDVDDPDEAVLEKLRYLEGVGRIERRSDNSVRIETVTEGASLAVLRVLVDSGHAGVRTSLPSLEEVYLHLLQPSGLGAGSTPDPAHPPAPVHPSAHAAGRAAAYPAAAVHPSAHAAGRGTAYPAAAVHPSAHAAGRATPHHATWPDRGSEGREQQRVGRHRAPDDDPGPPPRGWRGSES